jgi:hypothetical protein
MAQTQSETTIPCSRETREQIIRPLKRGGESYDRLLRKMAAQYDPDATTDDPQAGGAT